MTIRDQIECARRELALRRNVYPKWIASNRMTKEKADREIETMASIVATLEKVQACEEAGLFWVLEQK